MTAFRLSCKMKAGENCKLAAILQPISFISRDWKEGVSLTAKALSHADEAFGRG